VLLCGYEGGHVSTSGAFVGAWLRSSPIVKFGCRDMGDLATLSVLLRFCALAVAFSLFLWHSRW
jgi:hypothetical protein